MWNGPEEKHKLTHKKAHTRMYSYVRRLQIEIGGGFNLIRFFFKMLTTLRWYFWNIGTCISHIRLGPPSLLLRSLQIGRLVLFFHNKLIANKKCKTIPLTDQNTSFQLMRLTLTSVRRRRAECQKPKITFADGPWEPSNVRAGGSDKTVINQISTQDQSHSLPSTQIAGWPWELVESFSFVLGRQISAESAE